MKKILILEDNKKIAGALALRLQAAGYEVHIESYGREGLKSAVTLRPDLMLMDVWLPDGASFPVVERLRQAGLPSVPCIFLTASRKPELWREALEAGAAGFFEKPYDPEKLLAAIAQALAPTPLACRTAPVNLPLAQAA